MSEVHSFRPEKLEQATERTKMKVRDHKRTRIVERFEELKGEKPLNVGGEKFTSPTQFLSRVQQGKGHLVVALNTAFKAHSSDAQPISS